MTPWLLGRRSTQMINLRIKNKAIRMAATRQAIIPETITARRHRESMNCYSPVSDLLDGMLFLFAEFGFF